MKCEGHKGYKQRCGLQRHLVQKGKAITHSMSMSGCKGICLLCVLKTYFAIIYLTANYSNGGQGGSLFTLLECPIAGIHMFCVFNRHLA